VEAAGAVEEEGEVVVLEVEAVVLEAEALEAVEAEVAGGPAVCIFSSTA